jgi:hypothetical protein
MVVKAKRVCLIGLLMGLAIVDAACNMPGMRSFSEAGETAEVTPDDGGAEDSLPPDTASSSSSCTYAVSFVVDVTIPDGAEIEAGTVFENVWRVRSSGCVEWPSGSTLVFDHGDPMDGPGEVPLPDTALGETADVGVTLTAPDEPGEHYSYWQFEAPDGTRFGQVYTRIIVVPASGEPPADDQGRDEGGEGDAPDTQGSSGQPDLAVASGWWDPWTPMPNESFEIGVGIHNDGDAASEPSTVLISGLGAPVTIDIPSVAPGDTHEASHTFPAGLPAGSYDVTIAVDAGDENDELDEDNNQAFDIITIGEVSIHSTAVLSVTPGQCLDMDIATIQSCGPNSDFMWMFETDGVVSEYHLLPQNGAAAATHASASAPTYVGCSHAVLHATGLYGGVSDADGLDPGDLPEGRHVCFQTNEGHYGSFRVTDREPSFMIHVQTWALSE